MDWIDYFFPKSNCWNFWFVFEQMFSLFDPSGSNVNTLQIFSRNIMYSFIEMAESSVDLGTCSGKDTKDILVSLYPGVSDTHKNKDTWISLVSFPALFSFVNCLLVYLSSGANLRKLLIKILPYGVRIRYPVVMDKGILVNRTLGSVSVQ